MSLDAAARFFGMLALVAAAATIALILARVVAALRHRPSALAETSGPVAVWLAALVAVVATLGSLYFSEVQDLVPCRLCWYQRIAMYPLAVILPIAAARRDAAARVYAVVLAAIGLLVAAYHYLLEWHPQLEAGECDAFAPCSTPWFRAFGFVSLSFMAICAFAAIIAALTLTGRPGANPGDRSVRQG